jgi:N-acyl-D-aspartate/D-glutamate deacylase
MRSEGDQILEALEEAIEIGRRAALPVEIYHLKVTGAANWAKMPLVIERIERARADGVDVTADMYPYVGSGTGLTAMLPPWSEEGGRLFERLDDPAGRFSTRAAIGRPWAARPAPAALCRSGSASPSIRDTSASGWPRSPRCAARSGSTRCSI